MSAEIVSDTPAVIRVLLIRHGETVDNVKGVYAGVTDSALTSHGVLQASRLGSYLAKQGIKVTNIFCSDLLRAKKTAEAIKSAQESPASVELAQLQCLREQDFGYYEGKPFYARTDSSSKSGKDEHHDAHMQEESFKDVETKESMRRRCEAFIDDHLYSLLDKPTESHMPIVAVVSHGMLLSSLWKTLLSRQLGDTVSLDPDVRVALGPGNTLEHLGGWSNTGYLDLDFLVTEKISSMPGEKPNAKDKARKLVVKGVNKREHLTGLKRTRGGVGSAQYDESQRSIDSFFKMPRLAK